MRNSTRQTELEAPRKKDDSVNPETPMPTGSGVLGSRPQPLERAQAGIDPEAVERRRFRRVIKEKS